ncbi:aldose 1-epimerase [Bacteroidales bacterium 6E]|nr:aldose 1-epimerase [Bacteroidales bacterium 6E]
MKNLILILIAMLTACNPKDPKPEFPYTTADFESVTDGAQTSLFTLRNDNGMVVTLTNYGAKIVSILVPDRSGKLADVMLGFKSLDDYKQFSASHGATVGPFANRIGNGSFMIGDSVYNLEKNNGNNTLHSGPVNYARRVWGAVQDGNSVVMNLESPDGEYGFPGNRSVTVKFTLTAESELRIDYHATTDKPTHMNLTNHGYFNLRGEGNGDILAHVVVINADSITAVDEGMIPTGELLAVKDTPLDFNQPKPVGANIDDDHPHLKMGAGYDFNYVIDKPAVELGFAASAYEPESGRYMEVFTTEPGVQLYTGNHLRGNEIGKAGVPYTKRTGICFETQHYPDSPNKPNFPSTLLVPGEPLVSTTIYKFSVQ